jgi:prepilin-type processing-associated H-X9-DG protein
MSGINDGAGTTLQYAENSHKTYDSQASNGGPAFGWVGSYGTGTNPNAIGVEQQLGFVWVVPETPATSPVAGNSDRNQEPLNRADAATFPANIPRYARPAAPHNGGMNVTFCDGHGDFLRDDIDYKVYQQLMTPNGRKCVDPSSWTYAINPGQTIDTFRNGPPLAEKDYR